MRAFSAVGGAAPFIRRARGARIEDEDGRSYVDFVMSWGPLIHGHAPAGLTRALAAAAKLGTSFGAPTAAEVELGTAVRRLMPSLEWVRFVNSGTEATMSALRLARAATGRHRVVKFAGCFHGHGDAFLVQAGSGATTLGVPTSPGVPPTVGADTLVAHNNDPASVERLFRRQRGRVAAVIVEPAAGNMGVVPPEAGFLDGLPTLCDEHGAILIFDEVVSGFRAAPGGRRRCSGSAPTSRASARSTATRSWCRRAPGPPPSGCPPVRGFRPRWQRTPSSRATTTPRRSNGLFRRQRGPGWPP